MSRFQYCRLCAKLSSTTIDIFEDLGIRKMLHLKILQNLNLKVSVADPLTKHVCILCAGKLDFLDRFRLDCYDALIYLRKKLYNEHNNGPENEIIDLVENESDTFKSSKFSKNEKNINSSNLPVPAEILNEGITIKSSANVEQQSDIAKVYLKTGTEDDLDVQMEVVEDDDDDYYDDDDEDDDDEDKDKVKDELGKESKDMNKPKCETDFSNSDEHHKRGSSIDSKSKSGTLEIESVNFEGDGENNINKLSCLSVVNDRDNIDNADIVEVYLEIKVEDDLDVQMEVVEDDDDEEDEDEDKDKEKDDVDNESKDINKLNCESDFSNSDEHHKQGCSIDSKSKCGTVELDSVNFELDGENNIKKHSCLSVVNDRGNIDNRSEDKLRNSAVDKTNNDIEASFVKGCDADDDYDGDNDYDVDNNDKELNDNDVGNDHQSGDNSRSGEEVNKTDVDIQDKSSISELYFRRENVEEIGNDNAAMLFQIIHCLGNLYYGKCSFMPYFMKWPRPDGSFRVGFKCFCCNRFYYTRTDILDHIFEHLSLSCNLCKMKMRVKPKFVYHMSKYHLLDMKDKKIKCTFCSESVSSIEYFMEHVRQHHEYHCGFCSFHTPNHNKLIFHIKHDHYTSEKDCVDCLVLISDDLGKLKNHILNITEKNGFVCKFCGIGFHTEDFLKLHYEIYGSNHGHILNEDTGATSCSLFADSTPQKACDLVVLPTRNEGLFNRKVIKLFHDIVDKKIELNRLPLTESEVQGRGTVSKFQCPLCHKPVYHLERNLISHVRNHLLLNCTKCQQMFKESKRFKTHMLRYHSVYEYKCIICENVSFDKISDYLSHVKIHKMKKMCNYCSEVFPDNREKCYHVKRMHKDKFKKLICDYCGLSFIGNDRLKAHLSVHTGSKIKLICSDCGNGYKSRHSHKCFQKEKNEEYICAYCSKAFVDKCRLISHIKVHMNLKTFECKICKKCFNRVTSLQKHVKDMHSERKWKCTIDDCDKSYTYKSALYSHMKKGHQMKVPK